MYSTLYLHIRGMAIRRRLVQTILKIKLTPKLLYCSRAFTVQVLSLYTFTESIYLLYN